MRSFFVHNLGCRAAQADGAAIESILQSRGLAPAEGANSADVVVLNSCTVTEAAEQELRHLVRRTHRDNQAARIVVTGCYAQRAPQEIAKLAGVSMVVGNTHKAQIGELFDTAPFHGEVYASDIFAQHDFVSVPADDALLHRSRPNLKIQDGCNNRCSFCVIPFVRGRSRSMNADEVVHSVRALSRKAAEVVLTGINLGRWGREPGSKLRLVDVVRRILDETEIARVRLSSVEPMDWSDDLLALMAESPRVAKHVHAPLQSGSDSVLRRMYRKYRPRHYEDRVRKARNLMPHAAIGADVLVGFPGETHDEFNETVAFVEALPFTYLHVFPYSERPGTPAASSPNQVPQAIRKERVRILKSIAARKNEAFRGSLVGRTLDVATFEDPTRGLSGNYVEVHLAPGRPPRQLIQAVPGGLTNAGLYEHGILPVLGQ